MFYRSYVLSIDLDNPALKFLKGIARAGIDKFKKSEEIILSMITIMYVFAATHFSKQELMSILRDYIFLK